MTQPIGRDEGGGFSIAPCEENDANHQQREDCRRQPVRPLPNRASAHRRNELAVAEGVVGASHARAVDARPAAQHDLAVRDDDRREAEARESFH